MSDAAVELMVEAYVLWRERRVWQKGDKPLVIPTRGNAREFMRPALDALIAAGWTPPGTADA